MRVQLHGRAGQVYRELARVNKHYPHIDATVRLIATNLDMPVSTVRYNLCSLELRGLVTRKDTKDFRNFGAKQRWVVKNASVR